MDNSIPQTYWDMCEILKAENKIEEAIDLLKMGLSVMKENKNNEQEKEFEKVIKEY